MKKSYGNGKKLALMFLVSMVLLGAFMSGTATAAYEEYDGYDSTYGGYVAYVIELPEGGELSYTIDEIDGSVDVYLMTEENYQLYSNNNPYETIEENYGINVALTKYVTLDPGDYRVVVESNITGTDVSYHYHLKYGYEDDEEDGIEENNGYDSTSGGYKHYIIDLPEGGGLSYTIDDISGGAVDVYLMTKDNYDSYANNTRYDVIEADYGITSSVTNAMTLNPGTYVVVVESNITGTNVSYHYALKYGADYTPSFWDVFSGAFMCLAAGIIVLLIVIFIIIVFIRKKKPSQPYVQQASPQPQQYQAPPQNYPPQQAPAPAQPVPEGQAPPAPPQEQPPIPQDAGQMPPAQPPSEQYVPPQPQSPPPMGVPQQVIRCSSCGAEIPPGATNCPSCGAPVQ